MPVLIREIVTEVIFNAERDAEAEGQAGAGPGVDTDEIVRRTTERVLEILRREWDR